MLQSQPWYHVGEFIATQYNLFYSSAGQPVVMCERDFWLLQTFRLLFSEQVMRTGPGWGHCHWLFQFQRCSLTHFNYTRKDFTSWPQTPGKKTLGVLLPQAPFSPPKSHPFVFCKFSSFIFFFVTKNYWHPSSGGKKREHKQLLLTQDDDTNHRNTPVSRSMGRTPFIKH